MSVIKYPSTSSYFNTPQLDWRIGRYVHRPIYPDVTDRAFLVTPKYHNRPDRLSADLYGTPLYYWVFMARNMNAIRDPIYDLVQGMTIIVPTRDVIAKLK
jgi:hypothetical protein